MLVDFRSVDWFTYFKGFGLVPRAKRQRRNKGAEILNVYAAFDIETSIIRNSPENTDAHAFLYIWQYQIEDYLAERGRNGLNFCMSCNVQLSK